MKKFMLKEANAIGDQASFISLRILTIACRPPGQLGDTRYIDHCKQRLADDVFPWILNAVSCALYPLLRLLLHLCPRPVNLFAQKRGVILPGKRHVFPKMRRVKKRR